MAPARGGLLGLGDLVERGAQVHGARARDLGCGPGDRAVERPVELEHPRAVAKAAQSAPVEVRQARARQADELARGDVEQHRLRAAVRQLVERVDPPPRLQDAAQRAQVGRERLGQALRAAARHRPPDRVRGQRQHETEGGTDRRPQRQHRVGAAACEQSPGTLALETRARQPDRRAHAAEAEAGHQERVARRVRRGQQLREERLCVRGERAEQPPVGELVGAEPARGLLDRALEHDRRAVVERVRERCLRMGELEAVLGERERCSGTARRARARERSSRCRARSRAASARRSDSLRRGSPRPRARARAGRRGPGR